MSFILGFGLYGSTLIIPIYTQSILRWTTDAGLLLIPVYNYGNHDAICG
jgi:DHA2 family multidrug resistance protein